MCEHNGLGGGGGVFTGGGGELRAFTTSTQEEVGTGPTLKRKVNTQNMLGLAGRGKSELQFELSFTMIGLVDQKLGSFKVRNIGLMAYLAPSMFKKN